MLAQVLKEKVHQAQVIQVQTHLKLLGTGIGGTNTAQNINRNSSTKGARSRNRRTSGSGSNSTTSTSNKPKRNIWNGVSAVTGRYFPSVAKGVLGTGLGLTGAIIGFSSGVAQGDVSKAFTGLAVGATAGNYLARNTVDTVQDLTKKIPEAAHNVADTYREGAYGKEYADNVRTNREFRNSSAYSELKRDSGFEDKAFDEKVSQMLDSGITDTKRMKKILKNHKKHPRKYSMDKAIAYSEMAEKCPDGILYDNNRFIRFCQDHKIEISEEELENLRKCIIDFR